MLLVSGDISPDMLYSYPRQAPLASGATDAPAAQQMPQYQFLTNHAQVLLCVAHDPGIRLRDIAQTVGVTERSAHRIVSELVEDGYVVRERVGRRNVYKVKPELPLRHPLTQETEQRRIGDLLEVLLGENGRGPARRRRQPTT
jgi:predicted DNA-binding transcriptional regulator